MPSHKRSHDAEIRRLFTQPLAEFTVARNELAKRLRREGGAAAAQEVKALAKPTPSAWAVTALFAREPDKVAELVAAGQRARVAQREAVSGRGAQSLKDAIRAARGLADELRWEAGQILAEAGRPPSRTMVERIAADLQALAFDPAAQDIVDRGWLERDLEPPGFEVLTGLSLAGAPVVDLAARREARRREEKKETKKEAPEPERSKPSAREVRQAEAARRREEAQAARREREARKLREQVEAAKGKVERARAEAATLSGRAEAAEKAAAEARRAAQAADRTADQAREKAEQAASRLARAESDLREIEKESADFDKDGR